MSCHILFFPRTPRLFAETIPLYDEEGTIAFPRQYPKPISLLPRVVSNLGRIIMLLNEGDLGQKDVLRIAITISISITVAAIQGISVRLFPGLVNFVPAVAYLFCLNLPAAFS